MQPILGMPILGRVIDSLCAHGINDFIVVLNPSDDQAHRYLQKELKFPVNLKLVCQDQPIGAGHALQQAAPFIQGSFILSACDNLIMEDELGFFLDHWRSAGPLNGLLALMEVTQDQIPHTGIVELDGRRVINILEKPNLEKAPSNTASLPLYVLSPKILEHIHLLTISPRGEYELQSAIQMMIDREGDVLGFHVSQRLSLTNPADLLQINRDYIRRERSPYQNVQSKRIGENSHFIPPVHIEAGTVIGTNCTIGPEVYIEKGSYIGNDVTVQKSIVLEGAELPDGAKVNEELVLNKITLPNQ